MNRFLEVLAAVWIMVSVPGVANCQGILPADEIGLWNYSGKKIYFYISIDRSDWQYYYLEAGGHIVIPHSQAAVAIKTERADLAELEIARIDQVELITQINGVLQGNTFARLLHGGLKWQICGDNRRKVWIVDSVPSDTC